MNNPVRKYLPLTSVPKVEKDKKKEEKKGYKKHKGDKNVS